MAPVTWGDAIPLKYSAINVSLCKSSGFSLSHPKHWANVGECTPSCLGLSDLNQRPQEQLFYGKAPPLSKVNASHRKHADLERGGPTACHLQRSSFLGSSFLKVKRETQIIVQPRWTRRAGISGGDKSRGRASTTPTPCVHSNPRGKRSRIHRCGDTLGSPKEPQQPTATQVRPLFSRAPRAPDD